MASKEGLAGYMREQDRITVHKELTTWCNVREAIQITCLHRLHRRRILLIGFTVGTILVGINQSTVLASGHFEWVLWVKIAADYVTPTVVGTLGVLAGTRKSTSEPS